MSYRVEGMAPDYIPEMPWFEDAVALVRARGVSAIAVNDGAAKKTHQSEAPDAPEISWSSHQMQLMSGAVNLENAAKNWPHAFKGDEFDEEYLARAVEAIARIKYQIAQQKFTGQLRILRRVK